MQLNKTYVISDNIISALGFSTEANIEKLRKNQTGLKISNKKDWTNEPLPLGIIDPEELQYQVQKNELTGFSKFEQLLILSTKDALEGSNVDIRSHKTIIIISTTKGNIDQLQNGSIPESAYLWSSASKIQQYFSSPIKPLIISNACISGVLALNQGMRMIRHGLYDNVIVTGSDILCKFIISGFQSFKSLSLEPCKPFDINRDGLSIGEGAGTIILSKNNQSTSYSNIELVNGASANDANHISGPSRTGEGLYLAIKNTLKDWDKEVDYISAHGTATPYNDDMESKAIKRNKLELVPVNSFKGYIGHTLGAAGIIEAIMGLQSMQNNYLIKTQGCNEIGVAENINIIVKNSDHEIKTLLKTGSGFGGSNAAALFYKHG